MSISAPQSSIQDVTLSYSTCENNTLKVITKRGIFSNNKPAALEGQPAMLRKIRRLRTYSGIKFAKMSDTCFLKMRNFDREMIYTLKFGHIGRSLKL